MNVQGIVEADDVAFRFENAGRINVQGHNPNLPKGTLNASDSVFIGNPGRTDDLVIFEKDSIGTLKRNLFGLDLTVDVSGGANVAFQSGNYIRNLQTTGVFPDTQFVASNTYWGTWEETGAIDQKSLIEEQIFHKADHVDRAEVVYQPWLNAPSQGFLGIERIVPGVPIGGTVNSMVVRFDRPVLTRSFTPDDVLITPPNGSSGDVAVLSVQQTSNTEFIVRFEDITASPRNAGPIGIVIGPDISTRSVRALLRLLLFRSREQSHIPRIFFTGACSAQPSGDAI